MDIPEGRNISHGDRPIPTRMRADIYIPESELEKLEKLDMGQNALTNGFILQNHACRYRIHDIASRELEKGLEPPAKYKGNASALILCSTFAPGESRWEVDGGYDRTAHLFGGKAKHVGTLFVPPRDRRGSHDRAW